MQKFIIFLAQGLASGRVSKAPGTFGTLTGMLVFYFLIYPLAWQIQLGLILWASIFGIWLTGKASKYLNKEDPSSVVWDEWVGIWLSLFLLPASWAWYLAAFVLFRIFDISKPLFIGYLDKNLKSGLGIMLDDIAAGLLVFAILQATIKFALPYF